MAWEWFFLVGLFRSTGRNVFSVTPACYRGAHPGSGRQGHAMTEGMQESHRRNSWHQLMEIVGGDITHY